MRNRIEKVQEKLRGQKIDGLLVTDPVNILYLTGFVGADSRDAYVVVCRTTAYFLTSALYRDAAQKLKIQNSKFKTLEINYENKLSERIKEIANPPAGGKKIKTLGFEEDNLTVAQLKNLKNKTKPLTWKSTTNLIEDLRMIKDADEIAALRKAAKLTDDTFSFILGYLSDPGNLGDLSESQLAWEIEKFIRENGGELAFSPIVAFDANSANPHHVPTKTVFDVQRQSFSGILFDFGASIDGYCADMTRMVFVGKPTEKQRKIYTAVLEAQEKALEYLLCQKKTVFFRKRQSLSGSKADEIARAVFAKANLAPYPHSLGHGVGLQIHEGFRVSHKKDFQLKPAMAFTIEPGYYETGWGGMRIEDTVLLRDNTVEILTKSSKRITIVSS